MKHRRKVKGEPLITLQMAQELKTKNISVIPVQLFCHQCKNKFDWLIDCNGDEDKGRSVTDIDDEFTKCQTPRKKLQSIVISSVSLHAVPQLSWITNAKMNLIKLSTL